MLSAEYTRLCQRWGRPVIAEQVKEYLDKQLQLELIRLTPMAHNYEIDCQVVDKATYAFGYISTMKTTVSTGSMALNVDTVAIAPERDTSEITFAFLLNGDHRYLFLRNSQNKQDLAQSDKWVIESCMQQCYDEMTTLHHALYNKQNLTGYTCQEAMIERLVDLTHVLSGKPIIPFRNWERETDMRFVPQEGKPETQFSFTDGWEI